MKRDEHYGKRPIKEGYIYVKRDLYYEKRRILWKETHKGGLHICGKRPIKEGYIYVERDL